MKNHGALYSFATSIAARVLDLFRIRSVHCYCPICHDDLVGNGSPVVDEEVVEYKCGICGCISQWDFDTYPVPVLLRHQKLSAKLYKKAKS